MTRFDVIVATSSFMTGYWLGSIPFGLLLTRAFGAGDLRAIGSGSIGATNVLRTGRRGLAAATVLLDGGKGALAMLIVARLLGPEAALLAGLGAVLGHLFPIWLRFRGGKGVATGFGVLLVADWRVAVVAGLAWLLVAWRIRISSVAALVACALAAIVAALIDAPLLSALVSFVAALVVLRHRDNIRRLLAGTEPRIGH